ncbi:BTAD domain-containing putative transcriptional regulator [Streptomyces sp. NPDC008001]|uniref:BTAD domain-containing putative transcriptional regulator n=1 Tax=Streptomyces sp. NPDC008001 TaxID=3364804 RepID=UPI0036E83B56
MPVPPTPDPSPKTAATAPAPVPIEPLLSVLGPMAACHGGQDLPLGPPRRRALLALLLIRLGRVVPTELLVEELWGEEPPRQAVATLQSHVSHLRRALQPAAGPDGASVLRHRAGGYVLELSPGQIDACRFELLVTEGRRLMEQRDPLAARDRFTEALALWRGAPYGEFDGHPPLSDESTRLEHVRLTAVESCAEARLTLGAAEEVAADLDREARNNPARERLVGHLMTALSRLGRQAEALEVYERTRSHLAEEFGVGTAAALRRVRTAILRQEPGTGEPGERRGPGADGRADARATGVQAADVRAADVRAEVIAEARADGRAPALADRERRPLRGVGAGPGEQHGPALGTPEGAASTARAGEAQVEAPRRLPAAAGDIGGAAGAGEPIGTGAAEAAAAAGEAVRWDGPDDPGEPGEPTATTGVAENAATEQAGTTEATAGASAAASAGATGTAGAGRSACQSPFTGRSEELERLTTAASSALAGHGHVAGVLGPAGVGKTRLLFELTLRLEDTGGSREDAGLEVIWSHCFRSEGVPPYWLWTQVLRRLAVTRPDDFRDATAPFGALLAPLMPERSAGPGGGPGPDSDWGQARFLTHDAVCEVLLALAGRRPLVLFLEDLHWADAASLDLLRLLSTRSQGCPLAIVLTAREFEVESDATLRRMLSEVLRGPRTETLRLGGLSRQAVADLVVAQAGPGVDAKVVEVLHRRSEGNPYFVMQLLSLLGDARSLRRPDAVEVLLTRVPTGVREVLHQRFAALPEPVLQVLRLCAVIGSEVDTDLLHRTATEDEPVAEAMDAAIRAGLLGEDPHHPGRLHFAHALVQETLIDELGREDRQRLHARVAEALCARRHGHAGDAAVEQVAHHTWHARSALPPAEALPRLLRAAEQAEQQLAYEQVETWLRRAVQLIDLLPQDDPSAVPLEQRLHVQLGQVLATTRGYGHPEAESALAHGRALSAAAQAPEDPSVLWALCAAYLVTGRYDASRRFSGLLRDLAARHHEPVAVLGAAYGEGIVLHVRGRLSQALTELEYGVEMADRYAGEGHSLARTFQHDPRVSCRSYNTFTHWLLGDRQTARARRRQLLHLTEYDSRPSDRSFALYVDAVVAAWEGDARTARTSGAEGVRLAGEHGLLYWKGMLGVVEGWGLAHSGWEDEGLTLMQASLAELRRSNTRLRHPLHLGLLGQAQHHAGRPEEATATFRALLSAVEQRGEHVYLHEALPATHLLREHLGSGGAEADAVAM